jgi:hypothetical protein
MNMKRFAYLLVLLLISVSAGAQINLYLGANLQGNYSWIRADEHTFKPGFGGGLSFVYWEYEYWFIKAGLDYHYTSSSCLHFPEEYDIPITSPDDKVIISYAEHVGGLPLTVYFRPFESGENTLLITGTLEMMFLARLKMNSDEYGELILGSSDVKSWTKTNVGVGVGYQRQLDRHLYLNIVPSFHVDIRSERPFNSIRLTAEILFGIY